MSRGKKALIIDCPGGKFPIALVDGIYQEKAKERQFFAGFDIKTLESRSDVCDNDNDRRTRPMYACAMYLVTWKSGDYPCRRVLVVSPGLCRDQLAPSSTFSSVS